ncbi:MAG TPA: IS1634 family transposase, partial [Candidatus Limnocylindria bacterium]|nr:IS1634 family transposase [Candidatus Limnocylindria bacterium]
LGGNVDPIRVGLVASLARPGGNVTGMALLTSDLMGKRTELLKETIPTLSRLAVLAHLDNAVTMPQLEELDRAAEVFGIQVQRLDSFSAPADGGGKVCHTGPSGKEGAMQLEVVETVTKTIGALALVYPYLRRLGVAETLDALTTTGKHRAVPTGQIIEVLIVNRLAQRPAPISQLGAWAQTQAIEAVYGLTADALNDDRIGRALDEVYPHLTEAWAALVLKGVQTYGLRLDQLHSDVTRVAFEGAYDDAPLAPTDSAAEPAAPRIVRGYTGKEDPSRKQVTLSLSVAADGALPAWYQVGDGNAADTQTYLRHLAAVREYLHVEQPLVVGDSKLITGPNLLGFCRARARFVGPTSLKPTDRTRLRQLWAAGEPVHRLDLPPADQPTTPGRYWALECPEDWADPVRETTYRLRRLFVQSLDDRRAARHQRAKDLARARRALGLIHARLGRPAYRQRAVVHRKVADAVAKVRSFVHVEVGETPQGLDVRWRLDHRRLREAALFDGIYCLLTNWPLAEADLRTVFAAYKEQIQVEQRFRVTKHPPLQVRPVWLHQPNRIASLIFVVMVALFLFALIEREARRVVQATGHVFAGLRAEGRDHLPVTTRALLAVFAPLGLIHQRLRVGAEVLAVSTPATLTAVQAQILERLDLMKPEQYLQPTITPHPT